MRPDPPGTADRSHAPAVLVVIHVVTWTIAVLEAGTGFGFGSPHPVAGTAVVVVVGLLHLRHAFAAVDDRRPRHWPITLAAMVLLLCGLPLLYRMQIANAVFFVGASAALLLPRRGLMVWITVPILYSVGDAFRRGDLAGEVLAVQVWYPWYSVTVLSLGMLGLYATARVAGVLNQFRQTRAETEAISIGTERLRLSRDLHDTLGQSLTAIALKAEVARRLYPTDATAAALQVRELAEIAERTRADLGAITAGYRPVTFAVELDGALRLLRLAGIDTTAAVHDRGMDAPVDDLLAWAVREGTANVLRHSRATRCAIALDGDQASTDFVMNNDRAEVDGEQGGSGLNGLAERADAVGATIDSGVTSNGWFRLAINVPNAAAATRPPAAQRVSR